MIHGSWSAILFLQFMRCSCSNVFLTSRSAIRSFGELPAFPRTAHEKRSIPWVAVLVYRYLSNTASFVLCVVRCVKDHYKLLDDCQLLKKSCVRQVVLRKWFPLNPAESETGTAPRTCPKLQPASSTCCSKLVAQGHYAYGEYAPQIIMSQRNPGESGESTRVE